MSDSLRHASAQRSRSRRLVPGVVYGWTPNSDEPMDPAIDSEVAEGPRGLISLKPGAEVVAGYHLDERIGAGCTGEVWRAIGPGGVAVAMKFIAADQPSSTQELRSLELMRKVRHANLLTIFGIWKCDDWTAIGMDLADGSLMDRFESATRVGQSGLDFAELTDFLRQAARGIDFLNGSRPTALGLNLEALAHRDIKPQNLLLVGGSIKVGDFGLVKRLADDPNQATEPGTDGIESLVTAYSSPEVCRGELSSRSDQYSLAATYCHLRAGRAPSTLITAPGTPGQSASDGRVDVSMLPAWEHPVVARALATDPEKRWPTCTAFVEALVASTQEQSTSSAVPVANSPPKRSRRVGVAVLLTAITLAAFALNWSGGSSPPRGAMTARPGAVAPSAPAPTPVPEVTNESVVANDSIAPALVPAPMFIPPSDSPSEIKTDSLVETASIVAAPPLVPPLLEPATSPPTNTDSPPVAAPPLASPLLEPVALPPTNLFDPPSADRPADPATIEALPVVTERGPGLSWAEIKVASEAWWDTTRDRLETRLVAARNLIEAWIEALTDPAPATVLSPIPTPPPVVPESPALKPATIFVRMPTSQAELIVRGDMSRGNPDEWSGPRRVIHSPPLAGSRNYLISSFWVDLGGRRQTRSLALMVEPGRLYEVDLRFAVPTAAEVSQPSPLDPVSSQPSPTVARKRGNEANPKNRPGLLNRLPLPHLKGGGRRGSRPN